MLAVIIPVGPHEREVGRLHALLSELASHEDPATIRLVVIDDAPRPRQLRSRLGFGEQFTVRTGTWDSGTPDALSAHVAGTLAGLRHAVGTELALKLDTDAAVIAPFSGALREAFADPQVGVVGAFDRASDGGLRDWSVWRAAIDRASWPVRVGRRPGRPRWAQIGWRPSPERRAVRRVREAAYRAAPPGAHCLGGAYAVSRAFLERAELDWRPWIGADLGEDVVVGLLCSAAGLRMHGLNQPGEPFAVSWRGLPAPPEVLRARGHRIVHSVRAATEADEHALRRALQGQGAPMAPPGSRL